ncbi:MAG: TM2 domain-containing membrane protein YozV [Chloroflexi bacterium]|jgi:hypothetical protein|nr:MAG: TM2 domain-containing membrane protein YozV [Chloroflexota bacterium]
MPYCSNCGAERDPQTKFCSSCGQNNKSSETGISEKSFVTTLVLVVLLGVLGVHRFYVGKTGTGILMLLTFGGLGIWSLVDTIVIAVQKFKDSKGLLIKA